MRYIIALLATNPTLYIKEAQKEFGSTSQDYLLSERSLPHITLAQFDLNDAQANNSKISLSSLWIEIQQNIGAMPMPRFIGVNATRKFKVYWNISLAVAREPMLVNLHKHVVNVLKQII